MSFILGLSAFGRRISGTLLFFSLIFLSIGRAQATYIRLDGQADSYIDDLTFTVSVPESNAFILLWLGLLMIYLRNLSHKKIPA